MFLTVYLLDSVRLIYHELWIFFLFLLMTLIFRASARKDNPPDKLQRLIAFSLAALALDRILNVGATVFWVYQPWLLDYWIPVIHFGLIVIEISFYSIGFFLLGKPIRERLRNLLDD